MTMFTEILRAQWRGSRFAVVFLAVLGFAAPLTTVYWGGELAFSSADRVAYWLAAAERIAALLPYLALLVGVAAGFLAWAPDHAGRHVYALSLPVSRARFVALRFGAGGLITLVPAGALLVGAFVAALSVHLPEGLHAYPVQLTVRFVLASLTIYAIIFALSIATKRAQLVIAGLIGGAVVADVILAAWGAGFSVTATTLFWMTTWPGPLSILAGSWALFDV